MWHRLYLGHQFQDINFPSPAYTSNSAKILPLPPYIPPSAATALDGQIEAPIDNVWIDLKDGQVGGAQGEGGAPKEEGRGSIGQGQGRQAACDQGKSHDSMSKVKCGL